MKKVLLSLMAGSVLFAGAVNMVNAADGTVHFTGSLTDDACTVDSNSADQTVVLGVVSTSAFSAAGDKASPTKFDIKLTDCPATVTGASVKFDGISDSINTSLLQLDNPADAASATGVGIEIADASGTAIPLHTDSGSTPIVVGDNTLHYVARYVATAAAPTAGDANGTSQFTINYQ